MKNKYVKHAHISEVLFWKVLKLFCADIPARTTGGLTGLSVQGTQSLYDGLRLRIMELALEEARPFAGEVEIDESYFGARRVRGKRGRGAGGKTPVIGLLKRGGKDSTRNFPTGISCGFLSGIKSSNAVLSLSLNFASANVGLNVCAVFTVVSANIHRVGTD